MNDTAMPSPSTAQRYVVPPLRRLDAEVERPIRPHERPAGGEPLVREEVVRQRAVVHERVRVGERELHRLDLEMRPRLEAVVERQREERRDALAVRRQLADLDPAVGAAQRLDPLRAVGEQVVLGEPRRRRRSRPRPRRS